MQRISRFRVWVFLALLGWMVGCQGVSEEDLARKVTKSEAPAEQIIAAREYLARFPDGTHRSQVARAFFNAAVETKDGTVAAEAADALMVGRSGARLSSARNSVAWTLAEHDLALAAAEKYARALVADARKEKSSALPDYLDTLAFVLYHSGSSKEAEQLQKEAIAGRKGDPAMVARLALYQQANGEHLEAMQNAASAILQGDEGEIVAQFPTWLNDDGDAEETARQIIEPAVSDYLLTNDDATAQGRAALLMALGNIDLARAESMIRKALNGLGSKAPNAVSRDLEVDLAQVLCARGDYAGAADLLEPQEAGRSPWDGLYWFTLGRAYRLSDRPEKAEAALLQPLLVEQAPLVKADLRELGLSDDAVEARLRSEKEALESFDPGTYSGSLPLSGRTVLLELFTGAECNPCKAADLAVDLTAEYFPRSVLAILEYHVHIPGADPLTTPASEARYKYYDVGGTPTLLVDGQKTDSGGGPAILKKSLFERYRNAVERSWSKTPTVRLDATAERDGMNVRVQVKVVPSDPADNPLPKGVIRVALVEKSVDYAGGNGIERQAFVVRNVSGVDEAGATLVDGAALFERALNLERVTEELRSYLDDFAKNPPERYKGFGGFRAKPVTIDPENLGVVVWVEDRESKVILQSEYIGL